ncbi:hypothetical protein [Kamptonema formosum]|uniref:hypothetical protein n=1 Tax=Kamptonema formosum TaxID=331992 RepID=UPI0003479EED|nr:hypothetical protein [Oscillatoria sp. PCC 10802]
MTLPLGNGETLTSGGVCSAEGFRPPQSQAMSHSKDESAFRCKSAPKGAAGNAGGGSWLRSLLFFQNLTAPGKPFTQGRLSGGNPYCPARPPKLRAKRGS